MTIGEKLQRLRKARGWTQEELAAQVGVSRQSLSKWESDAALPDTANVIALCDLFGVTTDYLLREDGGSAAQAPSADTPAASANAPRALSPYLVIGSIMLVLGFIVWFTILILSVNDPYHTQINGREYTGVMGYVLGKDIPAPYYTSLVLMAVGAVTVIVPPVLQWARKKIGNDELGIRN